MSSPATSDGTQRAEEREVEIVGRKQRSKTAKLKKFFETASVPQRHLPIARRRQGTLPRKGHQSAKLNRDQIFEATQYHVKYTRNGATLTGLEKYNDCKPYGISENDEKELLKAEINRLAEAAQGDEAILFDSQTLPNLTDANSYGDIANIADQLKCSMGIVRLDNARISLEHCSSDIDDTIHNFRHARMRLMGRFSNDKTRVQGGEPKLLEPADRNKHLYFAMIDYITASIARLIFWTADSVYWNQQILSCLASCTTKVKILSYKPERHANLSIENAECAIEEMTQAIASKETMLLKLRIGPDSIAKDVETLATETDATRRYHSEKTLFNKHVWGLIRRVLYSLLLSEDQQLSASCFEIHAAVYKAGLDGAPTTVSSGRMGEISASSDRFCVKSSYTALGLVYKNIRAIKTSQGAEPPPRDGTSRDVQATITCEWDDPASGDQPWKQQNLTAKISDVVSVLVPLALASTFASSSLLSLIALSGSGTLDEDPLRQFDQPSKDFKAVVNLSTADWISKERRLPEDGIQEDDEVSKLHKSPQWFGIRAGARDFAKAIVKNKSGPGVPENDSLKLIDQYHRDKSRMSHWVIAEDTVTIKCRRYCFVVITIAVTLVVGAMAIPFAVRDKIKGVDPFQITAFTWVLVGFFVVLAKSRFVNEWPWHDFIHWQVVCKSVHDICDVSGIDAQTVLTHLLHEEKESSLQTKGPFNGMFSSRTDGSRGFSIDEPTHTSTMLASGFIVLKAVNEFGEHLVSLDVRKTSSSIHLNEFGERLCCRFLEDMDEEQAEGEKDAASRRKGKNVKRLVRVPIRVKRVLGLYVKDDYFG